MKRIGQVAIVSLLAIGFGLTAAGCALGSQVAQAPVPTARVTLAPVKPTPGKPPPLSKPPSTPTADVIQLGLSGGVVVSNTGSAVGLRVAGSTLQLQTTANTIIVVPGVKNAQLADIHAGDRVIANIPGNDPNTPAALLLDIPVGYTADNIVTGVVQANTSGALAVKTDTLPRRVMVNGATFVVDLSGDRPLLAALSEVQSNNAVMIIGQPSGDTFTAQIVVIAVKDARNIPTPGK